MTTRCPLRGRAQNCRDEARGGCSNGCRTSAPCASSAAGRHSGSTGCKLEHFAVRRNRLTSHKCGWENQAQSSGIAFVRTPAALAHAFGHVVELVEPVVVGKDE